LVHAADIQAGETVLITGALGAVGRAATQIARLKKAKVIGSDISDKASEADAFVNAKSKDLSVEVKALTGGKGVETLCSMPLAARCSNRPCNHCASEVAKWPLRASVTDTSTVPRAATQSCDGGLDLAPIPSAERSPTSYNRSVDLSNVFQRSMPP
jgi:NAD(P)-dependent dehydrogenase (short-subunit alcohol dehydrogenase family)